jgi:hypothetical protein
MDIESILKGAGIAVIGIGTLTMGYAFVDDTLRLYKSAKIAKAAEIEYFGRKLAKKEKDKCYSDEKFKGLLEKRLNEKGLRYYLDEIIGFPEPC